MQKLSFIVIQGKKLANVSYVILGFFIAVVKTIHYLLAHIFVICDETYLHLLLPVCKIANFYVYASVYFYIKKNLFISNV